MTDTLPAGSEPILLAFSGGLDTSFLVPWLKENYGRSVITVTVDTGGIDADAAKVLEQRARALGAPHRAALQTRPHTQAFAGHSNLAVRNPRARPCHRGSQFRKRGHEFSSASA